MTTKGAIAIAVAIVLSTAAILGYDAYKESQKVWWGKPCSASQVDEYRPWGENDTLQCVEGNEALPYYWYGIAG